MAREFRTRPLPMFVEAVREYVRLTGQPETHPDLFTDPIDRNEPFEILSRVLVNQRKRPQRNRAPCPMCTADKFLDGRLCWFPKLKVAAVIGHCCADHATNIEAKKRFRSRADRDHEETYLLAALPLVPEKLRQLEELRATALEARRLKRKILREARAFRDAVAHATQKDGQLLLTVELEGLRTGTGPAGFRGSDVIDETLNFGVLRGLPLFSRTFDPVKTLDEVRRYLAPWSAGETEEAVVEAICGMDDVQRHRGYTVLSDIDHRRFPRLAGQLKECAAFFEDDNLERVNRWGGHGSHPKRFYARRNTWQGQTRFVMGGGEGEARLVPAPELFWLPPPWQVVPKTETYRA